MEQNVVEQIHHHHQKLGRRMLQQFGHQTTSICSLVRLQFTYREGTSPKVHLGSVKSFGRLICTVLPENISDK
jgi:hypothetical protein